MGSLMFSGREKSDTRTLPMMPVRDLVIFPYLMTPFVVGREGSIRALEEALAGDKKIFLATQHDAAADDPKPNEIYQVGTIANIVQSVKLPDGNIKVLVEGLERGKILKVSSEEGYFRVSVKTAAYRPVTTPSLEQLVQRVTSLFEQYAKLSQSLSYETVIAAVKVEEIGKFTDTIAANLNVSIEEKQELLEIFDPVDRLTRLADILEIEIEKLNVDRSIQGRVKRQMERAQREYYLNEKIKAIQKELGRNEKSEIDELKKKIETSGMAKDALEKANAELKRLELMPPMSAESTVSRNYLDWLLAVPWKKKSKEIRDIRRAETILEEDHYGLEKIKERILEFLAVRQLVKNPRGSILCFVGPPGVGKTSLGRSIARATGRKFVRLSLGGVRDEAEVRGHRRTYIGALPGQIIQGIRRAETRDPVFMLDEVDKIGRDFRGDPSSALLEVLDPEQNSHFRDNYLDVQFDLSRVLFICTANVLDTIPPALLDRMEVLDLQGYTEEEKIEIAFRHLIPKQTEEHGIKSPDQIEFTRESLSNLIRHYTREAGVRNLEREAATICRKQARKIAEGATEKLVVTPKGVEEFLGIPRFRLDAEIVDRTRRPGVAVGLAWTPTGGDILFVESNVMKGGKNFTMTGQLGQVMQESMQAALAWVRSNALTYGIDPDFFQTNDIHIHVPAGAIPKDGPSAGVTMVTTLVSALTRRPIRERLAMTGEITLSGQVLPIGGIKEKVLAAKRAGIREILLPADNEPNVREDLNAEMLEGVELHYVKTIQELVELALEKEPVPIETVKPALTLVPAQVGPPN